MNSVGVETNGANEQLHWNLGGVETFLSSKMPWMLGIESGCLNLNVLGLDSYEIFDTSNTWIDLHYCQGCISSPSLFNLYAEYFMRKAGLDEAQAGIKIVGRNINNLRYADDTALMAESEEELKSLALTTVLALTGIICFILTCNNLEAGLVESVRCSVVSNSLWPHGP